MNGPQVQALVQPRARARPRKIADSALVLGDRPLRPGVVRSATSRFRDMVWRLGPAVLHEHGQRPTLHFAAVPERFRLAAKELFYALLAGEPPPGLQRLRVATIRGHFSTVLMFLTWADERGVASLGALNAEDLAAYQQHLLTRRVSPARRQKHRHAVRLFWVYRGGLLTDQLGFDPEGLEAWEDASSKVGAGENRTERIPEGVLGPLLGWALRWVDEFADDVVRAHDEWRALHANTGPNRTRRAARAREVRGRLEGLLARYRAERRPLPRGRDGWVNRAHLARELDCSPRGAAAAFAGGSS